MTRQLTIFAFILTLCLTNCRHTKTDNKNQILNNSRFKADISIIAILPFDTIHNWPFKGSKPIDLTNDDLEKIESLLIKCVKEYNTYQERQFEEISNKHSEYKLQKKNFSIDLKSYKRQYIAAINSKGEKEVWINCFCDHWKANWRKDLVVVIDGGNCYFSLKINLTNDKYYELIVNGDI